MKSPFSKTDIKIAVLGGGTGSFTILSALKSQTKQLVAIVNMVDDGGSTGVLRDEFGTLPSGDIRQCLVALSNSPKIRDLFNYRFEDGLFGGHSFGNLLLTVLEKINGDLGRAVETASEILRINGVVIPATLDNVRLRMTWPGSSLILNGERVIDSEYFKQDPRRAKLSLVPTAKANPLAVTAIRQADIVVVAPGDLYTSVGPLLSIKGVAEALKKTEATCLYVCNLVTKQGQTNGFSVSDHAKEIERFVGGHFLDYVIYNQQKPDKSISRRYKQEGATMVRIDTKELAKAKFKAVGVDLLGGVVKRDKNDILPAKRSFIRHDTEAITKIIMDIVSSKSN